MDAPQVTDVQISPDGRRVAYVLKKGRRSAVWIDGARFSAGAAGEDHPRWSPDGRRLAFRSDRSGRPQLMVISASGGEALALTEEPGGIGSFAWSPRGDRIAFTSADRYQDPDPHVIGRDPPYSRLRTVPADGGPVAILSPGGRHAGAFAWSPDGEMLAFVARRSPRLDDVMQPCTVETTAGRVLARLPASPRALRWVGAGLFYTGTVAMAPCSSACLYRLEGGERVLGGDRDCLAGLCGDGPDDLAALVARGIGTAIVRVDPQSGAHRTIYAPEGGDLRDASVVGEHWAAVVSFASRPPEVYKDGRPITAHGYRAIDWSRPEPFHWRAPDGLELDGVLLLPPTPAAGPRPLICLVHGGPYSRATLGFSPSGGAGAWGHWLSSAGYAVLLPNYRGGMGHGEAFAAAARGRVGHEDWLDVASAVDTAVARGIADPQRLGVAGWSQGGFLAACAITRTHRFRAAVVGAGVSDWDGMVMSSDLPTFEAALAGGAPWEPEAARTAYSPVRHAAGARTPTLILHGREDARVPVSQGIGLHRALQAAGCESELVLYPREPHAFRERAHQLDVLARIRGWFARHLG